MIDIAISEKLNKLKEEYSGDNVSDEAKQQILEWESRIQKLSRDQDFFLFPATKEIYARIKERVKEHLRSRVKASTIEELKYAEIRESECRWLLSLFNVGYADELETLEQVIDAEL